MRVGQFAHRQPSRRDALRILAVGGAGALAWTLGRSTGPRLRPVARSRILMGTGLQLLVLGDDRDAAADAAEAALGRMAALESLLSRYRSDSEVTRLNTTGRVDGASSSTDAGSATMVKLRLPSGRQPRWVRRPSTSAV